MKKINCSVNGINEVFAFDECIAVMLDVSAAFDDIENVNLTFEVEEAEELIKKLTKGIEKAKQSKYYISKQES